MPTAHAIDFEIHGQEIQYVEVELDPGEGVFFPRLHGPGHVWPQSLPFSGLAGRILANLRPLRRGPGKGTVLGPFGSLMRGD